MILFGNQDICFNNDSTMHFSDRNVLTTLPNSLEHLSESKFQNLRLQIETSSLHGGRRTRGSIPGIS